MPECIRWSLVLDDIGMQNGTLTIPILKHVAMTPICWRSLSCCFTYRYRKVPVHLRVTHFRLRFSLKHVALRCWLLIMRNLKSWILRMRKVFTHTNVGESW